MTFAYHISQPVFCERSIILESDEQLTRAEVLRHSTTMDGEVNWGDDDDTLTTTIEVEDTSNGGSAPLLSESAEALDALGVNADEVSTYIVKALLQNVGDEVRGYLENQVAEADEDRRNEIADAISHYIEDNLVVRVTNN